MPNTIDTNLRLIYQGGIAENNMLDLYDASKSYYGLARALAHTTHALVHEGAIRHRGTNVDCAQFYVLPSRRGSFEEVVQVAFNQIAIDQLGVSVLIPAFWDFLSWGWHATIGQNINPRTPFVSRLIEENPGLDSEVSTLLEPSIIDVHRPIQQDPNIRLVIQRPRVGPIIEFNSDSLNYVSQSIDGEFERNVIGNITKHNILGIHGRAYLDNLGRTIAFVLQPSVSQEEKRLLTWSMDQYELGFPGKLSLDLRYQLSANNQIKRVHIFAVRRVGDMIPS